MEAEKLFHAALEQTVLPDRRSAMEETVRRIEQLIQKLMNTSEEMAGEGEIESACDAVRRRLAACSLSDEASSLPIRLQQIEYLHEAWAHVAETLSHVLGAISSHRSRLETLFRRREAIMRNLGDIRAEFGVLVPDPAEYRTALAAKQVNRNFAGKVRKLEATMRNTEMEQEHNEEKIVQLTLMSLEQLPVASGNDVFVKELLAEVRTCAERIDPSLAPVFELQERYADVYRSCLKNVEQENEKPVQQENSDEKTWLEHRKATFAQLAETLKASVSPSLELLERVCAELPALIREENKNGQFRFSPQGCNDLMQKRYAELHNSPEQRNRRVSLGIHSDQVFCDCDYDLASDFLDALQKEMQEQQRKMLGLMSRFWSKPDADLLTTTEKFFKALQYSCFMLESIELKRKVMFLHHPLRALRRWGISFVRFIKETGRRESESERESEESWPRRSRKR